MRFELIFLGKTKEEYLATGIDEFVKRLKRFVTVEVKNIKPPRAVKGAGGQQQNGMDLRQLELESGLMLERVSAGALLVALDPGGRQISSEQLAGLVSDWEANGQHSVAFVLGGHLGLAAGLRKRADLVLSLSSLTFTHELARLLLVEQLYRAYTIKNNTGYHK